MIKYEGPDIFRFGKIGGKRNYAMWMLRWLCQHGRRPQFEFMNEYHRIGSKQTGWGNGFGRFVNHEVQSRKALIEHVKTATNQWPKDDEWIKRSEEWIERVSKHGVIEEQKGRPKMLQWVGLSPSEMIDGSSIEQVRSLFTACEYLATNVDPNVKDREKDVEHAEFWMQACLSGLERRGERP